MWDSITLPGPPGGAGRPPPRAFHTHRKSSGRAGGKARVKLKSSTRPLAPYAEKLEKASHVPPKRQTPGKA